MISTNPYTNKVIAEHPEIGKVELEQRLKDSHSRFLIWRETDFEHRSQLMKKLAILLKERKDELSILITAEMGKRIGESQAEIEKCAWLCDYYAEHEEEMLEEEGIPSDGTVSYLRFDPVGVIYAIMPWNFPFWQVLRFAVPTILAGNTVVLKHAPNVIGCAKAIEKLFVEAGSPKNIFCSLIIPIELSETVIANEFIQGVTLTGSQTAGSIVASQAGRYLKKTVMELGGSDPFIVMADADFNLACKTGTDSRMLNSGQVCIAAKRFIVEESIFERFVEEQKTLLENLKPGDPMLPETTLAPMARKDLLESIDRQVKDSIKMGAKLVTGGYQIDDSNFYTPTLLVDVKKGMPVYDEETFGPVSVIISAMDADDAIRIANDTTFGLGASIWTKDMELADEMASKIDAGAVFINGMVKSDPRLPFGGTKQSGYGRELSHYGIREFVNIKTVWFK